MKKQSSSVLFIGDRSMWSRQASRFLELGFEKVDSVFWEHGMAFPRVVSEWEGDWILSFKSDLLLDVATLDSARLGAINFHPAPPWYRGIGGYHYATDKRDPEFGVTCHHMDSRVDHGQIIDTIRFSLIGYETPELLSERTAASCLVLFYDVVGNIVRHEDLPRSTACWGSTLYTRKELARYLAERAAEQDHDLTQGVIARA